MQAVPITYNRVRKKWGTVKTKIRPETRDLHSTATNVSTGRPPCKLCRKALILTFRKPRWQPWRPCQLLLLRCQEPCSKLSLLMGRSYRCDSHKARIFHQWSSRGLTFRKPSCLLFWLPAGSQRLVGRFVPDLRPAPDTPPLSHIRTGWAYLWLDYSNKWTGD